MNHQTKKNCLMGLARTTDIREVTVQNRDGTTINGFVSRFSWDLMSDRGSVVITPFVSTRDADDFILDLNRVEGVTIRFNDGTEETFS